MQRITLLCIGSLKEPWTKSAADFYRARLDRALRFDVIELPASKHNDPAMQKKEESARLLEAAKKADGEIWILHEGGKAMTSAVFARNLAALRDEGTTVTFVLGGAYGLTEEVIAAGMRVVKLSDMTFPHELCRVVLLEQLYRATEIMKGSGYHH